ncbi:serine/threonine-protein kinase [Nocardia sp. NPDC005825]|uniref:serine/threonine-protein kinase n=1 Tax=unclassified Nocardia TaxID=2637762 RepID=UPI0033E6C7CF
MATSLQPGEIFAGFKVVRLLGSGGFGEVYLAQKQPNGLIALNHPEGSYPTTVALKLLDRSATSDPVLRRRFEREAEIVSRLVHPNIITVYGHGEHEGRLWISMKYIHGPDLGKVLRSGAMDPEAAVQIVKQVASALDYARDARQILHRDVKPANILLGSELPIVAILTDFGIAKDVNESTALTDTAQLIGSFQYFPPERFNDEGRIDRRADVYALGCTFFYMLTGQLPYQSTNLAQLAFDHSRAPIPLPSGVGTNISHHFDSVITTALAKDRQSRFRTCTELAEAAQEALTQTRGGKRVEDRLLTVRDAILAARTDHPSPKLLRQIREQWSDLLPGGLDSAGQSPLTKSDLVQLARELHMQEARMTRFEAGQALRKLAVAMVRVMAAFVAFAIAWLVIGRLDIFETEAGTLSRDAVLTLGGIAIWLLAWSAIRSAFDFARARELQRQNSEVTPL